MSALARRSLRLAAQARASSSRPLILDMDGVLYKNALVEGQIVQQLELETRNLNLEAGTCQRLYDSYGSTIRGLISEGHLSGRAIEAFYEKVYSAVELTALRPDPLLAKQLTKLSSQGVELSVATNSPEAFVRRVFAALRLPELPLHCPTRNGWHEKPDARYFVQLPKGDFFDDNERNCRGYEEHVGGRAYHVGREMDVMTLVADALEVVPATWRLQKAPYLQAKEAADLKSLNQQVLERLRDELRGQEGEVKVLDLGCGLLSMLPVIQGLLPPGARLQYTAVDKDPQLLAAPRGGARTWCGDAAAAVRALGPQSLVVGCSILDLIDVVELSEALRTHQPGALLYFPIHYAGSTSFQGPLAKGARALSESYDESLETRGQIRNVTELYGLLGSPLMLGASDWRLRGEDPLLKQLISFMAVNGLGFQRLPALRGAVAELRQGDRLRSDVELRVANVDFLGRVAAPPGRLAVEFGVKGRAQLVGEAAPKPKAGEVEVVARLSGLSAGTERHMLRDGPGKEPLDTELPALQEGGWPFRYGYCLVGSVGDQRVFCFHPHASQAVVPEDSVLHIPEDIPDEDAIFFANMETACSLCQDAAPVLGDRISVHGCGVVGALTSRLLARMGHEVRVVDPVPRRLEAAGAPQSFAGEADVSIEVSGSPQGLAEAVEGTRRGGKVLLGSLYAGEVRLPLGLRFHRAEILLQSSQVSRVAGRLQPRWSKSRRARLTWEMLREIKPKEWVEIKKVPVMDAVNVYRSLLEGEAPMQWIFTY